MILLAQKSFEKDIEKIKDGKLAKKIFNIIQNLESINSVAELVISKK